MTRYYFKDTDTHTRPTALNGPLKWSVKTTKWMQCTIVSLSHILNKAKPSPSSDRNNSNAVRNKAYKCSAVAKMGDRLATIDMGRKLGGCAPFWGESWISM